MRNFLVFLIIGIVAFLNSYSNDWTFKYQVLLLGDERSEIEKAYTTLIEEMLFSWNIPFQKFTKGTLNNNDFFNGRTVKFTSVIITRNFCRFSDKEIKILKKISKNYGVSIISFFSFADDRSKELFGIEEISEEKIKSISFKMTKKLDFLCENFSQDEVFRGGEFLKLKSKKEGVILESKDIPIFFYNKYGKGINYFFNFSPQAFLIFDGKHSFLLRAIFENSGNGFIYFDFEGICALRCDDPLRNISWEDDQSYQKFHYKRMEKKDWGNLIGVLKKHDAGMSLAVVTGFKDDGEKERGDLYIKGRKIKKRVCGQVFDSRDIRYVYKMKGRKEIILDYEKEFEGIKFALENYQNLDIQQHGFIHVNPEISWCEAPDKHTNFTWGVEFYNYKEKKDISEEYQKLAIKEGYNRLVSWFNHEPAVFVPPGLLVSSNTGEILKEFGYKYYFDGFTLKKLVRGDYRNLSFVYVVPVKDLEWGVKQGYIRIFKTFPTILGLHDADFTYFGVSWFDKFLTGWKKEGVKRFISLGELVSMLSARVYAEYNGQKVKILVDISEPVGPKNLESSNYFREKEMVLHLKIPDKWKKKGGKETLEVVIPPFKDRNSFAKILDFKK